MFFVAIIAVAVAVDQAVKYFVITYLSKIVTLPLINGVLHFTYAENTGAAFSMFRGKQIMLILVTVLIIMFALGILYRNLRTGNGVAFAKGGGPLNVAWTFNFALSLVVGGAIGNLIDRLRFGYVVDFVDFRVINFAIFNLADCFIVIGTLIAAFLIVFKDLKL